jgi:hypothetical protein
MTKRIVVLAAISAMLLSGCGRPSPASPAGPILLGGGKAVSSTVKAPVANNLEQTAPVESPSSFEDDSTAYPDQTASESQEATSSTLPSASPSILPSVLPSTLPSVLPSATPSPTPTPTPTPSASATPTPSPSPTLAPNAFIKAIGSGSLDSANGLAVAAGKLYVVDNARTGLLGKFAAVRVYDVASGAYAKLDFENIGWSGAKNMPTSVTRVKLEDGNVLAANDTTTYVYKPDASLLEQRTATFALPTQVTDPVSGDIFRLNGNKIERVHAGSVVASFGSDVITQGTSIAVDENGDLFVSDNSKATVYEFGPASN